MTEAKKLKFDDFFIDEPGLKTYGRPPEERKRDLPSIPLAEIFGNDQPIFLDIGCGKGRVLTEQPLGQAWNYVGIEKSRKYAAWTARRLEKRQIGNARVLWGYAEDLITMLDDASIARASFLFPDPWHKDRHKKRRYIRESFLALLRQKLADDAVVWIVTDHEEYFEFIKSEFEKSVHFIGCSDLPPEALTHFELKYREEGRPVYRTTYCVKTAR